MVLQESVIKNRHSPSNTDMSLASIHTSTVAAMCHAAQRARFSATTQFTTCEKNGGRGSGNKKTKTLNTA
jgi:hypothetical protein